MTDEKQPDVPLFDLTQDDDDWYEAITRNEKNSAPKADYNELDLLVTDHKKNRQAEKSAITLNSDNEYVDLENESDESSDCILILSPENVPRRGNGKLLKAPMNREINMSHEERPGSVLGRGCDYDSDDDLHLLLSRPAFSSSAMESISGNPSFCQTAKFASSGSYKEADFSTKISSTLTFQSSKATDKEKRQQLYESEKQQKASEKEKVKLQQAYEKQQKEVERERVKRQREVEKLQKQQDRKRLQQEKQQQKEQEKLERQQCLLEDQQEQGKFAQQEICIHLEKSLADSILGGLIQMALSDTYMVSSPNSPPRSECVGATTDTSTQILNGPQAQIHHVPPIVEGCIQWSRRDYVSGGATAAYDPIGDDGVEWLDIVAVVFYDPKVFLRLLTREILGVSEEDDEDFEDDFPLLRAWVKNLRESHARARYGACRANSSAVIPPPRIVLILHKVQDEISQQWVKNNGRKKRRKSFIPANEDELQDAVIWMLIEERIECAFTTTDLETIDYIKGLTRALSESPYAELMTELQCIKKLKSTHGMIDGSENSKDGEKSPYIRAKDSWLRMLQQIKGLTEGMALRVVRYYPTARSLMDKYEDPTLTIDQKKTLLATLLMDGKRNMVKLSDSVYRLMTSEDPMELII